MGLEPTSPFGRRFSRPVQYQLCDGSNKHFDGRGGNGARMIVTPPPVPRRCFGDHRDRRFAWHPGRLSSNLRFCRATSSPGAAPHSGTAESGRPLRVPLPLPVLYRGARIRTGDLCDPNAALYRTEPRPVGENESRPGPTRVTPTDGVGFDRRRPASTRAKPAHAGPRGAKRCGDAWV